MKGLLTISVIFGALVAVSVSLRGMTLPNEEVCFVPGGPCYLVEIANDPGERAR
ncbi:MAG TPA: hypothetical protein PK765_05800 [bacterium]|nr:hypothetical protein [bacterium]